MDNNSIIYVTTSYKIVFNPDVITGRTFTIEDFIDLLNQDCWLFCVSQTHETGEFEFKYNYYPTTLNTDLTNKERIQIAFNEKVKLRKLILNKDEILSANYDFMVIYVGEHTKFRVTADRQPDGSYYFRAWGSEAFIKRESLH